MLFEFGSKSFLTYLHDMTQSIPWQFAFKSFSVQHP